MPPDSEETDYRPAERSPWRLHRADDVATVRERVNRMATRLADDVRDEMRTVPFDPSSRDGLLSGQQTSTTRRRIIGPAGTRFMAFGHTFEVVSVCRILLCTVAERHYRHEGYATREEFRLAWAARHPRRGWQPGQLVYHHVIRKVQ